MDIKIEHRKDKNSNESEQAIQAMSDFLHLLQIKLPNGEQKNRINTLVESFDKSCGNSIDDSDKAVYIVKQSYIIVLGEIMLVIGKSNEDYWRFAEMRNKMLSEVGLPTPEMMN